MLFITAGGSASHKVLATTLYGSLSLLVFSYAVFILHASAWFFALMMGLDLMFHAYLKASDTSGVTEGGRKTKKENANGEAF